VNEKIDRQKLIDSARLSARVQGCLCQPEVRLRELRPKIFSAEVLHDRACPLAPGGGADA